MKNNILSAVTLLAGAGAVTFCPMTEAEAFAAQTRGDIISVSDGASLSSTVLSAPPGSTIVLAAGNYPRLIIRRDVAGAPIRITGPREARVHQILFLRAEGWRVDGITLVGGIGKAMPADIAASRNIMLINVKMTGATRDPGPRLEESNGIVIRDSEGIVLALSEVTHVKQIASLRDSFGVVIEGNQFTNAREGLMVRANHGLMIRHNIFVGWKPRFDIFEHPDMIQFMTQAVPTGSSMVTIEGNYLSAGEDRAIQGIFVRAEAYEAGRSPMGYHRNFTIRNNVYHGSSRHGMTMSNVRGLKLVNNTLIGSPHAFVGNVPRDPSGRSSAGFQPAIVTSGITWGRVQNNITPLIGIRPEAAGTREFNNFVYRPLTLSDASNPGYSFGAPLTGGDLPLKAFAIRARSANGIRGRGANVREVGPNAAKRDTVALMIEALVLARNAKKQDLTVDPVQP